MAIVCMGSHSKRMDSKEAPPFRPIQIQNPDDVSAATSNMDKKYATHARQSQRDEDTECVWMEPTIVQQGTEIGLYDSSTTPV